MDKGHERIINRRVKNKWLINMKKSFVSLIIKEIQIKMILKDWVLCINTSKVKKKNIPNVCKLVRNSFSFSNLIQAHLPLTTVLLCISLTINNFLSANVL